jgi:hypothetical protein
MKSTKLLDHLNVVSCAFRNNSTAGLTDAVDVVRTYIFDHSAHSIALFSTSTTSSNLKMGSNLKTSASALIASRHS